MFWESPLAGPPTSGATSGETASDRGTARLSGMTKPKNSESDVLAESPALVAYREAREAQVAEKRERIEGATTVDGTESAQPEEAS